MPQVYLFPTSIEIGKSVSLPLFQTGEPLAVPSQRQERELNFDCEVFVAKLLLIPARRALLPVLGFETRFVWTILLSEFSAAVAELAAVVADVDADDADPDAFVADVAA